MGGSEEEAGAGSQAPFPLSLESRWSKLGTLYLTQPPLLGWAGSHKDSQDLQRGFSGLGLEADRDSLPLLQMEIRLQGQCSSWPGQLHCWAPVWWKAAVQVKQGCTGQDPRLQ